MAVKIKLKRMGKIRVPQYRIIVADSRTRRDGRAIEEIGKYQPKEHPSLVEVNSERVQYWLGVGAQPTEPVLSLLKITGDWQRFKGLPGAENRVQSAPPKPDKDEAFNTALAEVHAEPAAEATTPKKTAKSAAKKSTAKKSAKKAEAPAAEAEAPAAEAEAPAGSGGDTSDDAAGKPDGDTGDKTADTASES